MVTESRRVTGAEPGGPPPRSTATTLTDGDVINLDTALRQQLLDIPV
jgi:hypothetical protein